MKNGFFSPEKPTYLFMLFSGIIAAALVFSSEIHTSDFGKPQGKAIKTTVSGNRHTSASIFAFNNEEQRKAPMEISKESSPKVFLKIYSVNIDGELYFADERVPLKDFDVRERLDRELHVNTYWHSNSIIMMKTANKYFPLIEKILAEEGIPDDFKYLAVAESGLRNVVSPMRAVGVWQFLERTGKEYGLEINSDVDERYDLVKSTRAACQYLKQAKQKFGSWSLAAASYNMGVQGVRRSMEAQKVDNYYDLYLNEETSRYVFRILALKEIFKHRENYGFYLDESDLYHLTKTAVVEVDTSITDLAGFAQKFGTTYKAIKLLNPWIRGSQLTNYSKKKYEIRIPLSS